MAILIRQIQDDGQGVNSAGVPYYGMLAFAQARRGCSQVIPVEFDAQNPKVSVYVLGSSGKPGSVVVVNRDSEHDLQVSLHELGIGSAEAMRLTAPLFESKSEITLGGASVDASGE